MDLNRETAMRLWNKSFGKESKVKDFAGRIMAKGAYNDRNSEFGWNVDHILPQSKGGATADHNLVCCHIKTNDEKADSFPCFNANGVSYEIVKVQNHYEIRSKSRKKDTEPTDTEPDLFDSAAGVRLFKSLKGIQNKKRFVGTVYIYLDSVTNGAVIDFIEKIFDKESISYKGNTNNYYSESSNVKITVTNYDMPSKSDTSELLDKCVLLNTYLSAYFMECGYIKGFDIYYRGDYFDSKAELFRTEIKDPGNGYYSRHNSMFVNELVLINTDAGEKVQKSFSEYTEYDYVFSKLKDNLLKEANG